MLGGGVGVGVGVGVGLGAGFHGQGKGVGGRGVGGCGAGGCGVLSRPWLTAAAGSTMPVPQPLQLPRNGRVVSRSL